MKRLVCMFEFTDGRLCIAPGNSPANRDGGSVGFLLADGTIEIETLVDEQGVHDTHLHGGKIYVAGTDPIEGWELGNIYIRDVGGNWTKRRTLPNVIHCFGMCHDIQGRLWVAVGAHAGDNATWQGRIMRSIDDGVTWELNIQVNNYRMFDVIQFDNRMYAMGMGAYLDGQLFVSDDDGATWTQDTSVMPHPYQRFIAHNGSVYYLSYFQYNIARISPGGSIVSSTPGGSSVSSPFNTLASDEEHLCFLDSDGYIRRSNDFTNWQTYSQVIGAISLGYWPAQSCLVASTAGEQAALWRVQI